MNHIREANVVFTMVRMDLYGCALDLKAGIGGFFHGGVGGYKSCLLSNSLEFEGVGNGDYFTTSVVIFV